MLASAAVVGTVLLFMAFAVWSARLCRKPETFVGQRLARVMNISHRELTEWGLRQIQIAPDARVLDVGCGGGSTLGLLAARASKGRVTGVDIAGASLAVSRQVNRDLIQQGRVEVLLGDVSALPLEPGSFDVVTAIETHYYWPSISQALGEIRRVLAPGGVCLLVAEVHGGEHGDKGASWAMSMLSGRGYTRGELEAAFAEAGLTDAKVVEHEKKNWCCATATAP